MSNSRVIGDTILDGNQDGGDTVSQDWVWKKDSRGVTEFIPRQNLNWERIYPNNLREENLCPVETLLE
jgi:hypothetical protein